MVVNSAHMPLFIHENVNGSATQTETDLQEGISDTNRSVSRTVVCKDRSKI